MNGMGNRLKGITVGAQPPENNNNTHGCINGSSKSWKIMEKLFNNIQAKSIRCDGSSVTYSKATCSKKKPPKPNERETKKNRKVKMKTTRAEKKNRNKDWTEYDSGNEARSETMITSHKNTQKNSHATLKSFGYYVNDVFLFASISSICRLFSLSFFGFTQLLFPFFSAFSYAFGSTICLHSSFIQHSLCWIIVSSAHDLKALHRNSQRVKFHTVHSDAMKYELTILSDHNHWNLFENFPQFFFFPFIFHRKFYAFSRSLHSIFASFKKKIRLNRNYEFSCNSLFGSRCAYQISLFRCWILTTSNRKIYSKWNWKWMNDFTIRIFAMCICINMKTQLMLVVGL